MDVHGYKSDLVIMIAQLKEMGVRILQLKIKIGIHIDQKDIHQLNVTLHCFKLEGKPGKIITSLLLVLVEDYHTMQRQRLIWNHCQNPSWIDLCGYQ